MITFVHLTPHKYVKDILRSGIKSDYISYNKDNKGIFCMPLTQHYFATYQWLRELKRRGQREFVAVHFQIPDDEEVLFGKYGGREEKIKVKASEAVKLMMDAEDKQGIEIIITRKINKKEIHKVVRVSRNAGWRYFPGSHQNTLCKCSGCISTMDFKGKQLFKKEYLRYFEQLKKSKEISDINLNLGRMSNFICTNKKSYSSINDFLPYVTHDSSEIRLQVMNILDQYFSKYSTVKQTLFNLCLDNDKNIRLQAAKNLLYYDDVEYNIISTLFSNDLEVKNSLDQYYKDFFTEDDGEDI